MKFLNEELNFMSEVEKLSVLAVYNKMKVPFKVAVVAVMGHDVVKCPPDTKGKLNQWARDLFGINARDMVEGHIVPDYLRRQVNTVVMNYYKQKVCVG